MQKKYLDELEEQKQQLRMQEEKLKLIKQREEEEEKEKIAGRRNTNEEDAPEDEGPKIGAKPPPKISMDNREAHNLFI